jgi:hypothetical protein
LIGGSVGSGQPPTEIQTAGKMNLHPSVITLSDGADDIDFKDCFESLVGIGSGTCQITAAGLNKLQSNLETDFAEIHQDWPGVPVELNLYFNPLPKSYADANTSSNSVCSVLYDVQQVTQAAAYYATAQSLVAGNAGGSAAVSYFNSIFSQAQSWLASLNKTLNEAATDAGPA